MPSVSFGEVGALYAQARPAYPTRVFDLLAAHGALRPGIDVLEVGSGSGLATRPLLETGVARVLALEPDAGFASQLDALARDYPAMGARAAGEGVASPTTATSPPGAPPVLQWRTQAFEAFDERAQFDLACCATAYHWLDAQTRVQRFANALRPGGHLALWWNVFGDPARDDPFHDATLPVLAPLAVPSDAGEDGVPFGLDVPRRCAELVAGGLFEVRAQETVRWTLTLDTQGVGALYGTFSVLLRLPPARRAEVSAALMAIAQRDFGGRVHRNMCTPVYLARRRLS